MKDYLARRVMGRGFFAACLIAFSSQASAVIIDSFELPDAVGSAPLAPATVVTGSVTVETGAGFGGLIAATDGTQFAYLTNGPDETGAGSSGVDRTGDFGNEYDIAVMTVGFASAAGDLLSFDWDLLTEEITGGIPDPFEVKLDGVTLFNGAVGDINGSFPSVGPFDAVAIIGPDGSSFFDGRLGWSAFVTGPLLAGLHSLEFFVGDDGDEIVDTALLVDNIRLQTTQVPEPGTLLLAALGLAALGRKRLLKVS